MRIFIGIFVCAYFAVVNGEGPTNPTVIFELRKTIFENYDKLVRPIKEPNDVVTVMVNLIPFSILDVDLAYQIVKLDTWIFIAWENPLLTWDPSKFGGIKEIRIDSSEVWTPDITLISATPQEYLVPPPRTKVFMSHNGTALWVLPYTIQTHCLEPKIKGNKFECTALIGSFVYDVHLLDLQPYPGSIQKNPLNDFYDMNPLWSMDSVTVSRALQPYQCDVFCEEKFVILKFKMTFERRPLGYDAFHHEEHEVGN